MSFAIGVYTHHMQPQNSVQADFQDALRVFGNLEYVRPEDMHLTPVIEREAKIVVYGR